jgi:hypothetical protein
MTDTQRGSIAESRRVSSITKRKDFYSENRRSSKTKAR